MTELQKFNFKDNEVRIHKDENGEPWFVAADVCRVLGIKNVSKATSQLDEDEFTTLTFSYTGESGKVVPHRVNLISESGLYALILRSNKPEAKPFRKWVTSEVLPAIRKTGSYGLRKSFEDSIQNLRKKNGAMNEVSEMVCLLYNINESLRLLQETPMVIREERMIETRYPQAASANEIIRKILRRHAPAR